MFRQLSELGRSLKFLFCSHQHSFSFIYINLQPYGLPGTTSPHFFALVCSVFSTFSKVGLEFDQGVIVSLVLGRLCPYLWSRLPSKLSTPPPPNMTRPPPNLLGTPLMCAHLCCKKKKKKNRPTSNQVNQSVRPFPLRQRITCCFTSVFIGRRKIRDR